ncbi:hypothetical protein ACIPD2_39545 [Streptomyces griseofuscus]|uniref:hypothetical protein n=1 Tax=Streptomyces griseofuscus TaxID=146922 RepID=UPI0037F41347
MAEGWHGSGSYHDQRGQTVHGDQNNAREIHQHHHAHYLLTPSDLEEAANKLAEAVKKQWRYEAGLRRLLEPPPLPVHWKLSERKVAGHVSAALAENPLFEPLPGLTTATGELVEAGGGIAELHAVYGGLASGRLLLVGPPAVGKTAASILLLLRAIRYRESAPPDQRPRIPVPVLFTLEGWDPSCQESATDWAVERLSRDYTAFQGREGQELARNLLENGWISVFLDGFDEVDRARRKTILRYLSRTKFRIVLVSRSKEAAITARKELLSGAVGLEVCSVDSADAAEYLLRPLPYPRPPAWQAVTDRLREEPTSMLAEVLAKPLAISLLRDVYGPDDPVDELLDPARFPTARAVEDHLLDHVVTAAYTPRPEDPPPPWSPETAERTMRYIAAQLTTAGTRELRWWDIPTWAEPNARAKVTGLTAAGVLLTVVIGALTPIAGFMNALVVATGVIATASIDAGRRVKQLREPRPLPSTEWRDVFPRKAIRAGAVHWLIMAASMWLLTKLLGRAMPVPLCFLATLPLGFSAALVRGSGATLVGRTLLAMRVKAPYESRPRPGRPDTESRPVGPVDVWRHHTRFWLPLAVVTGVAIALFVGTVMTWATGFRTGVGLGVTAGIWPILSNGLFSNLATATVITTIQLSAREGIPVRLLPFLEDARQRNLLRAVGPVYQFRHARFQERLATRR